MKLRLIYENMSQDLVNDPFGINDIDINAPRKQSTQAHASTDDGPDPFDDYFNINPELNPEAANKIIQQYASQVSKLTEEQVIKNNSGLYVSDMIDMRLFNDTRPFIYKIYGGGPNQVYFGEDNSYHNDVMYSHREIYDDLHSSYFAHSAGRIASGIIFTEKDYATLSNLVDMWDEKIRRSVIKSLRPLYKKYDHICFIGIMNMHNNQQQCVREVRDYAEYHFKYSRFAVIHNQKIYDYDEFVNAGAAPEVSAEDKEKGELQVALHIGAWPSGKPLTAIEKKQIRQKLGLGPTYSNKKTWRGEFNNAGLTRPGQKWWAMTSESKR